jgi:menaquinone-dependent protoporphyrinogen oxidase
MPRILILYGTTDGHTAKIARYFAGTLGSLGADVDLVDAGMVSPDPRGYAGVVVAASLHAKGYQRSVVRWAQANADALNGTTTAFFSVCLSVLQKDLRVHRELGGIVNRFEAETRWKPTRVKHVAGALLYTKYGWLKRWVMRRISGKAGGSTDVTRDHEYTDWAELRRFAVAFYAMCRVISRHQATWVGRFGGQAAS